VSEMNVEAAIQRAIAREQDAYDLYTNAKGMVTDAPTIDVLDDLAQQEMIHKNRIEALYDGIVYQEN